MATPLESVFSRAAPEPLRWLPCSPPRVCTAPAPRSAPPPPYRSSSLGCSQPKSAPSASPTPTPGSRLLALSARLLVLASCVRPLAPHALATSQVPALLPARARSLAICAPPSFLPPSLSCLLTRSLALRRGEAASQENPRNLCKKLTMKFKKFFDFGAIFEWIKR